MPQSVTLNPVFKDSSQMTEPAVYLQRLQCQALQAELTQHCRRVELARPLRLCAALLVGHAPASDVQGHSVETPPMWGRVATALAPHRPTAQQQVKTCHTWAHPGLRLSSGAHAAQCHSHGLKNQLSC